MTHKLGWLIIFWHYTQAGSVYISSAIICLFITHAHRTLHLRRAGRVCVVLFFLASPYTLIVFQSFAYIRHRFMGEANERDGNKIRFDQNNVIRHHMRKHMTL